jgi:hypothetical protein
MSVVALLAVACVGTFCAAPAVAAAPQQSTPQPLWNASPVESTPAPELGPQEPAVDPDGGSPAAALLVAVVTLAGLVLLASAAAAVRRIKAASEAVADDAPPRTRPETLSARARRVAEYTQAPAPLPKVAPAGWERCTIEWWRGYMKSDFYALATEPDGRLRIVGRSNAFRWRGEKPPPESDAAEKNLRMLVETLEDEGWEHDGQGERWYELSFKRPV